MVAPPAPRFRPGRRRAVVLLAVHLLVALHVVHWLREGETLSPVEPSEAMALSTRGVVNAGAVFFALALASTAVLGRWFCGWGCHVVALQDAARALLLLRLGITPRPLRSRALALVPLGAFVYMFVLPFAQRLAAGGPLGVQAVELLVEGCFIGLIDRQDLPMATTPEVREDLDRQFPLMDPSARDRNDDICSRSSPSP